MSSAARAGHRVGVERSSPPRVSRPGRDAALLAAHTLGLSRGETEAHAIWGPPSPRAAAASSGAGPPGTAQHITGTAPSAIWSSPWAPGLRTPSETELLVQLARRRAALARGGRDPPAVIDLGTGTGAIALGRGGDRVPGHRRGAGTPVP
ncbi:hypothetical protein QJS66_00145 [Kocuria rhizophila]|nr:hypothetical protein QJS66_00145 [Kocuria rhizophila]